LIRFAHSCSGFRGSKSTSGVWVWMRSISTSGFVPSLWPENFSKSRSVYLQIFSGLFADIFRIPIRKSIRHSNRRFAFVIASLMGMPEHPRSRQTKIWSRSTVPQSAPNVKWIWTNVPKMECYLDPLWILSAFPFQYRQQIPDLCPILRPRPSLLVSAVKLGAVS
jgi:hypothetical protein